MIKTTMRHWTIALALGFLSTPVVANQWDNYNEAVNMQSVLDPTNHMYDGYGSWYDDGTGIKFHGTNVLSGNPHPTNPPGHGYISLTNPILYQFDAAFLADAPAPALGILNDAFSLWDTAVNGTLGTRNAEASLGFDWARAPLGDPYQIDISWQNQAPLNCASVACVFFPNSPSFATPQLTLAGAMISSSQTIWDAR